MGGKTVIEAPKPAPPDPRVGEYYDAQTMAGERGEYQDWLKDLQSYQGAISKSKSGQAGYDAYKSNITNQMKSGLLTYSQAAQKLTDYSNKYDLKGTNIAAMKPGDDPRQYWTKSTKPTDFTTVQDYTLDPTWSSWNLQDDLTGLSNLYHGATVDDESTPDFDESLGLKGTKDKAHIQSAYKELFGEDISAADLAEAQSNFKEGYFGSIADYKDSLTGSQKYKDKFQQSYLGNYYDTMFGKEQTDAEGKKTGIRTFKFDSKLLPGYSGDLGDRTGVTIADFDDEFAGTPQELQEHINNIRDTRQFLFSSGLQNLQGNIDKETQKLKNEGGKEIARVTQEGGIYKSVVDAFNFS